MSFALETQNISRYVVLFCKILVFFVLRSLSAPRIISLSKNALDTKLSTIEKSILFVPQNHAPTFEIHIGLHFLLAHPLILQIQPTSLILHEKL